MTGELQSIAPKIQSIKIPSINPATGEVLDEIQCASDEEVLAAVNRAHAAQSTWSELGVLRRIEILREFQRRLHAGKSRIAEAITREAGKPAAEALTTEVLVVLDAARFLIDNAWDCCAMRLCRTGTW